MSCSSLRRGSESGLADGCVLCRGTAADAELGREQVWEDALWRLTTSVGPGDVTLGFSYLEPKRHIASVADMDGEEAATFGAVLARCTAALREAAGADLVYVYVFGDHVPHMHAHLAPHVAGDALNDAMIKGDVEERALPSGLVALLPKDYPEIDQAQVRAVLESARRLLN
jgi:diadenosine tetraphosphate (Ap4A) HIT family hydrolase